MKKINFSKMHWTLFRALKVQQKGYKIKLACYWDNRKLIDMYKEQDITTKWRHIIRLQDRSYLLKTVLLKGRRSILQIMKTQLLSVPISYLSHKVNKKETSTFQVTVRRKPWETDRENGPRQWMSHKVLIKWVRVMNQETFRSWISR